MCQQDNNAKQMVNMMKDRFLKNEGEGASYLTSCWNNMEDIESPTSNRGTLIALGKIV